MDPLRLPDDPHRPFTTAGVTCGAIYALAAEIRETLANERGPVCLAHSDRAVVAAAVLAALSGGPALVLPHAQSEAVLADAREQTGYRVVIGPADLPAPPGVRLWTPDAPRREAPPPALLRPDHEPFVSLFTGGSTGRPRIWAKTPANLMGEADFMRRHFGFSEADRIAATAPPLHIYGLLFSVLAPLLAGAVVIDRALYLPAEIADTLRKEQPTLFISGPVYFRALRGSAVSAPSLRRAFSSGSMLDALDASHFSEQTGCGVVEIYGSTESGGAATRCRADGEADWTPLPVVRFEVRDEILEVTSAFMSPQLDLSAAGLFVTGDRARITRPGHFILLGRADGIVKVAGKRVDLLEVEQKLRSLPQVADAHVLARAGRGARGVEVIALIVCPRPEAQLRAELAGLIEPQAMPRRFVFVDLIPTTAVGKRDKDSIAALLTD